MPELNLPENAKDVLPALTVMLVNGALAFLAALIILVVGWTLARWFSRWLRQVLADVHVIDPTLKPLIASMVRYIILAITLVAVMGQFGIQTTSLIALVGAAGLAVGLALQGTLSNVASGVMLLGLRPFRAYDRIKVGDLIGTVDEIGLFRTIVITDDGVYVSVPNASIFTASITNYSRQKLRRADFTVDIDHNEDIAAAQAAIIAALKAETKVMSRPAPVVEVDALNGVATVLSVQAWVANREFGATKSELRRLTRQALTGAGIRPPVPLLAASMPPKESPDSPPAEGLNRADGSPVGQHPPGKSSRHRRSGGAAGARAAGRLPHRDGLRPGRRRHQWRGRGRHLRRQGTAALQSADRACGRHGGGAAAGRVLCAGRETRRRLLARPADAGAAAPRRCHRLAAGERGAGQRGAAGAVASAGAGVAAGGGTSVGRA